MGRGEQISFLNYHLHMHVARIWAVLICDNYCINLKLNRHIQCGPVVIVKKYVW